ncbi:MAG: hotdog domain-containing protein [Candidatus Kryptoniota bacterium]
MKTGLRIGRKSVVIFEVQEGMLAAFEGKAIHNVLSTFHLVYYAELAARRMIEPYLEVEEEAAGFEINLKHIAPAKVGEEVKLTATLIKKDGKKLVCEIEAVNSKRIICSGTQTQVLIRKGGLD